MPHLNHFICSLLSHKNWKQLSTCCLNALSSKVQHFVASVLFPHHDLKAHKHIEIEKKRLPNLQYLTDHLQNTEIPHIILNRSFKKQKRTGNFKTLFLHKCAVKA